MYARVSVLPFRVQFQKNTRETSIQKAPSQSMLTWWLSAENIVKNVQLDKQVE